MFPCCSVCAWSTRLISSCFFMREKPVISNSRASSCSSSIVFDSSSLMVTVIPFLFPHQPPPWRLSGLRVVPESLVVVRGGNSVDGGRERALTVMMGIARSVPARPRPQPALAPERGHDIAARWSESPGQGCRRSGTTCPAAMRMSRDHVWLTSHALMISAREVLQPQCQATTSRGFGLQYGPGWVAQWTPKRYRVPFGPFHTGIASGGDEVAAPIPPVPRPVYHDVLR